MWDETEETLVGEEVTLVLSHTFFWMPHERIGRIVRNHGASEFSSALTLRGKSSRAYLAHSPSCRSPRMTAARSAAKTQWNFSSIRRSKRKNLNLQAAVRHAHFDPRPENQAHSPQNRDLGFVLICRIAVRQATHLSWRGRWNP